MHEFVPQPRRFYLASDDDLDEDYDVYLFYPSRNSGIQVRMPFPCFAHVFKLFPYGLSPAASSFVCGVG